MSPLAAQDRYEIVESYETRGETSTGGSSSSRGRTGYTEFVVASDGCVTRTIDLIDQPDRKRPLAEWQLPVTVTKCESENRVLMNRDEMEARLEAFLDALEATREVCGKHYFTWNVFKIECDPESVYDLVDHISLGEISLDQGKPYALRGGMGEAPLTLVARTENSLTYVAKGELSARALREEAARTEMVVREIYGEEVTLEEALKKFSEYEYSGNFTVTITVNNSTEDISRAIETSVKTVKPDGDTETQFGTKTTERRRVESFVAPDPSETQSNL